MLNLNTELPQESLNTLIEQLKHDGFTGAQVIIVFNTLFRDNNQLSLNNFKAKLATEEIPRAKNTNIYDQIFDLRGPYFSGLMSPENLITLRIDMLRKIITGVHTLFPDHKNHQPKINFADGLRGMAKLRVLVNEFLTKVRDQWTSMECPLLAMMILKEKHTLGLPCRDPLTQNMYQLSYGNADLSHIDLGFMYMHRDRNLGCPNIKTLNFEHSNLKGTTIVNFKTYGCSIKNAKLEGADFSASDMDIGLRQAKAKEIGCAIDLGTCVSMTQYRIKKLWPKATSIFVEKAELCTELEKKVQYLEIALTNYTHLKDVESYPKSLLMEQHLKIRLGAAYADAGNVAKAYEYLSDFLHINLVRYKLADLLLRSDDITFEPVMDRYKLVTMLLLEQPIHNDAILLSGTTKSILNVDSNTAKTLLRQSFAALVSNGPTLTSEKDINKLLDVQRLTLRNDVIPEINLAIDCSKNRLQHYQYYQTREEKDIVAPYTQEQIQAVIDVLESSKALTNPFALIAKYPQVLCFLLEHLNLGRFFSGQLDRCTTFEDVLQNPHQYGVNPVAGAAEPSKFEDYQHLEQQLFSNLKAAEIEQLPDQIEDEMSPSSPRFF